MKESGYYPPGAEFDPRAPYNQFEYEPMEFDVTVSQTLSKQLTLSTSDYYIEGEKGEESINTENVDWGEECLNQEYTPLELIRLFKFFLEENPDIPKRDKYLDACKGWVSDELEIIPE